MKHAWNTPNMNTPNMTTLPKTAPGDVTAGLNWAKDDHVVCVRNDSGEVRDSFTLAHLVNTRVQIANPLRAHLQNAFPAGALLVNADDSTISLDFLTRFTHQGLADWLSPKRLAH